MGSELPNLNSVVEDQVGFDTGVCEKYIAGYLRQTAQYWGILRPPPLSNLVDRFMKEEVRRLYIAADMILPFHSPRQHGFNHFLEQ
jgi:hypothetical protein